MTCISQYDSYWFLARVQWFEKSVSVSDSEVVQGCGQLKSAVRASGDDVRTLGESAIGAIADCLS